MRRPHIRSVAVAVAVTTAATGLAGTAFGTTTGTGHTAATAGTSAASVVSAARAAAFAHSSATGVSQGDELQAEDVMIDPEGARHVRFTRAHQGMQVLGGDLVVHLTRQLTYAGVTRAAGHTVKPAATSAKVSAAEAQQKAASAAKGDAGTAELVVDARDGASALAYQVPVSDSGTTEGGGSRTVVIDAVTGKVRSNTPDSDEFLSPALLDTLRERGEKLDPATGAGAQTAGLAAASASSAAGATRYPSTAHGTGKSLFVGTVPLTTTRTARTTYLLKDPTRWGTETRDAKGQELENFARGKKITTTNDVFGNGKVTSRNTAAADAQYGVTETLDFYKKTFGRKGIENNGKGARAMVHFGNKVANAFWDSTCDCMLYGDGDGDTFKKPLVALDVSGHELTHGVVDATAKLEPTRVDAEGNQYGEPGALNESLADVFGSNVEFFANNASDKPDYLIGEKMGLAQKFLRRLDHPSLDRLEGTIDYWSPEAYDAEVHAGSGVSSHAYYLLAEGSGQKTIGGVKYDSPTYDGSTVKGIGRAKATAIFYRALTRYMVSTTDFHDARDATLKAAKDLYGANSTEYKTVDQAWAAVNVTPANTPAAHR